jgi:hypothetical protein
VTRSPSAQGPKSPSWLAVAGLAVRMCPLGVMEETEASRDLGATSLLVAVAGSGLVLPQSLLLLVQLVEMAL